jgi:hypothetical protein
MFYHAFVLLLLLCIGVACDRVDWESRDLRFQWALVLGALVAGGGGRRRG